MQTAGAAAGRAGGRAFCSLLELLKIFFHSAVFSSRLPALSHLFQMLDNFNRIWHGFTHPALLHLPIPILFNRWFMIIF
jgi:hypothetical protein